MPSVSMGKKCGHKQSSRFFSANGEFLAHIPLKQIENYDHNRVFELLPNVAKRVSKMNCKIQCYTTEIKLKRSKICQAQPPRKSYAYKDIDRFYSFATNPNILVLGCSKTGETGRSYDFIKLDERHVQELSLLIERARNHPLYLLLDDGDPTARQQTAHSEADVVHSCQLGPELELVRRQSVSEHSHHDNVSMPANTEVNEPIQIKCTVPSKHSSGTNSIHSIEQPEEVVVLKSEPPVRHEQPESKKKGHPLKDDPLYKELCANINEGETCNIDMIYVDPESKQAKRDTSTGNVYMFVARYLNGDDDDDELKKHYQNNMTGDFRFIEGEPKIACN